MYLRDDNKTLMLKYKRNEKSKDINLRKMIQRKLVLTLEMTSWNQLKENK